MKLPSVEIDAIVLAGGVDQITPTLGLKNGFARHALNFMCSPTMGYTRVAGYERFDGRPAPSSTASIPTSQWFLVATPGGSAVSVGDTVTASNGASGLVKATAPIDFNLTDENGDIIIDAVGNAVKVAYVWMEVLSTTSTHFVADITVSNAGGLIGTLAEAEMGDDSPENYAANKHYLSDTYRNSITAVPGSGPVRGVFEYNDVVYAFRDNEGATALELYKSSIGGWVKVPFYYSVSFTAGTTAPADGATLTQGGVTATIKRVVRSSGSWTGTPGTAAGKFIITAPTGGNFASGAATVGTTTVTLSGVQTVITMAVGGKVEARTANFGGQAATTRVYGCDGKNKAWEFDGDVLVPIATGATSDKPTHIAVHRNYLFVSIGASIMFSAPGSPYDWTALNNAGEVATGFTVTGMQPMPGTSGTSALCVTGRDNTGVLYGTGSSSWNFVIYNSGTGAVPYSLCNMTQTLAFDDRGANSIETSLSYGNFDQTALTNAVRPFLQDRINKFTYATVCRMSSQYRLYFSDGYGLYITIVNGKLLGCAPVYFPNPVYCCYEGKMSSGDDIMLFGSDNGFVYQLDRGTSFDGEAIDYQLVLNFSNAKGPRTLKRYRRASIEITADPNTFVSFDLNSILGYDAREYEQPIEQARSAYIGSSRWDAFTWDNFYWDTNGMQPVDCDLEGTAENIALVLSGSSDKVASFTVNSILIHYTPRRMMR